MIELRDLRSFLTVVHEQHVGRAARRLHMSPAPLTQQLRNLERSLGIVLFERSSRRVELTAAGAALADGARRTLSELERAVDCAQRTSGVCESTLRVQSSAYASDAIATALLRGFRAEHPHVRVDVEEDSTELALHALRQGETDVAFVVAPLDTDAVTEGGLRALPVYRERFVAALPPRHRMFARRQLPLKALSGEPLVVLASAVAPGLYDLIGAACHGAGFAPTITAEAPSFDTVLTAVAAGIGVGLVPASLAAKRRGEVSYRPLTGMTATADVAMVHRAGLDGAARQLVAFAMR